MDEHFVSPGLKKIAAPGLILCIYTLAWYLQSNLSLSWDVSYLLHATRRMLMGGSYARDFFNPNPPMVLFLYTPTLLISKSLSLPLFSVFRFFIFLLASLSLLMCNTLLHRIFPEKDGRLRIALMAVLAVVFLIWPTYEFGQREHVFMLLIMPYVFLMVCRLQEKSVSLPAVVLTGVMAGIGFSIKPIFLIMLFMLESMLLCVKKNWRCSFRLETTIIATVVLLHLAIILLFFHDYVTLVLAYASQYYYQGIAQPWHDVFLYHPAMIALITLLYFIGFYQNTKHRELALVACVALAATLVIFYLQKTLYFYHVLPAFMLASLVLFFYIELLKKHKIKKTEYCYLSIATLLAFFIWHGSERAISTALVFNPLLFFSFFFVLFFLGLFLKTPTSFWKIVVSVTAVIAVSWLCSFLAGHLSLYPYNFSITLSVLLASFCILASRFHGLVKQPLFLVLIGMIMFSFPVFIVTNLYKNSINFTKQLQPLVGFLKEHAANQPVMFITTTTVYTFPNIDYAQSTLGQRYDCLWLMASLTKASPTRSANYQQGKNFVTQMITEDIHRYQPKYIFVDVSTDKPYMKKQDFDYLPFLKEDARFTQEWRSYTYLTTLDQYKLAVYQRTELM